MAEHGRATERGGQSARKDLAAMMVPLGRALMAAELPVLEAHGLAMWAYSVLLHLEDEPVRTQSALAQAIGADKTRIIGVLDDLERRGLILRRPDPADRRARLLSLTPEGRHLRDTVQSAIQHRENQLLARLPAADRRGFLNALRALSALPPEEITGAD
ncbi:MarR family winged helix-turn-helix transcriptional regulator [Streptomyces sp. NPDC050516]|uniref:MarR family winged helix-turn-helix transcriptional regulator n=1 Tax=Streptomyces sp. NPDC050516 TaxID=3365621 RepID=UPI0037AE9041